MSFYNLALKPNAAEPKFGVARLADGLGLAGLLAMGLALAGLMASAVL